MPELLGLVLRRLPSLADRHRLAAVCRPWRLIAQQEPLPPPLPWLTLLDGTFLSIPGGEIHRMHVPEDASLHGSAGNFLFLERRHGDLALMDLFSKQVERLPSHVGRLPMQACVFPRDSMFLKLVPLSTLDHLSPDSLFAVLMTANTFESVISVCRRPSAVTALRMPNYIFDIAFFDGKLYALSLKTLFAFEIVSSYEGKPRVSSRKQVAKAVKDPGIIIYRSIADKTYTAAYWSYLAEFNGKLLHVRRLIGALSTLRKEDRIENGRTFSFQVFELDLTTNPRRKWRRLNTLGDQALFVGTHSKSLTASECGAQEDCIYFVRDYDQEHWTIDPFRDCGVFNMRNGTITPLLLDIVGVRPQGCKGRPTWVFPTKAM